MRGEERERERREERKIVRGEGRETKKEREIVRGEVRETIQA